LLQFMVIFLNVYFQKVNIKKYAHTKILLSWLWLNKWPDCLSASDKHVLIPFYLTWYGLGDIILKCINLVIWHPQHNLYSHKPS
jgi:hypothetical protein